MRKVIIVIALAVIGMTVKAQTLGKFSFKDEGFTQKKFNHADKRIFIQQFNVNYQTIMVAYAKAKKGSNYGSATAGLALGLDGITNAQLQAMTDAYYKEFVNKLEAGGYTLISADEVLAHPEMEGRNKIIGGQPLENNPETGYVATVPNGFQGVDGGSGGFNLEGMHDSKKLDGMLIARVNISVPFTETRKINGGPVGGVAKIVAKCDLRVTPNESVVRQGDFAKPINMVSGVSFSFKRSLKYQALYLGKLKDEFEIEGVLDEDIKYKATSVATTGTGFTSKYSEGYAENAILVPCDPAKYEKGVNEAISTYLNTSVNGFLSYIK